MCQEVYSIGFRHNTLFISTSIKIGVDFNKLLEVAGVERK